ncbi:hypothetical protein ACQXVK_10210 [Curtobacterium sp. AB451]|uniref:hypothetical protein n=1 Tax=Curtobacterium sp. AB451 TaxID=3422306 RepID=UPI003D34BCC6
MARKKTEEPAGEALRRQYDAALGDDNEWDEKDLVVLELAARQANDIQALEAVLAAEGPTTLGSAGQTRLHPAIVELRLQRLSLARILAQIPLPDEFGQPKKNPTKQRASRRRWDRVQARKEGL